MPYFACPFPQQQQQRNMNALDPFLHAILSQLQYPEEADSSEKTQKPANTTTTTRPTPTPRQHNRTNRAFSPRFDVFETEDAYHLHGDLPGVSDKSSIGIEFTDHRTLLVTGRVERSVPKPATAPTEKQIEEQPVEEKRRSLKPTVEDTDDEDDFSVVSATSTSKTVEKHGEPTEKKEEGEKLKAWLSERTFGTFQRTFSFPSPVALEGVTAKLENGVLQIVVPKVRFSGVKKIEIE